MNNKERLELNRNKYIDTIFVTNQGYRVKVVKYVNKKNVFVIFENGLVISVFLNNLKKGTIRNPHHKSICDIGYFGVGSHISSQNGKTNTKYKSWYNLIMRCYNEKAQERQPTYKDVIVCEEWHNFQNFAEWYDNNYIESFALDKDILIKNNKIYSPETCCFVPQQINNLFIKSNKIRGEYPLGVSKSGKYFKAHIRHGLRKSVHLGTFNTPENAFQAYKIAKEQQIKKVADRWKGLISLEVYQAMYEYQSEITD